MAEKIRLNIDGKEVSGFAGQTILEVATENNIDIPTLCYDEKVKIYGACGLCVVEMEGSPKLLRACATTISNGMVISTNTERVRASRKAALELLMSDHVGDCRPPCSLNCPAGTDCQGYIGMVANGQLKQAAKLIKDVFPFPSSIGRICPHPCETACRRGLIGDPVSIAYIKAYIGDKDLESEHPYVKPIEPDTGHTVAIIGGGPAGLTAGYQLRSKGHKVTIYDAMPKMGGMLRYGIPEYRLPKAILDKEIALIEGMGIEMIHNVSVGTDISFQYIRENYDAVLVAAGAWSSVWMNIPGEGNENVFGGIDFLRKVTQGEEIFAGKDIAVVGGGNTAMDACRSAIRLGADHVYCIYRRTRDEMPAEKDEIREAEEEGVIFKFLSNPLEIISSPDGGIDHVLLQKMGLGAPDESGRLRPVPIEGKTEKLKVSALVMALGQTLTRTAFEGIELSPKGTILADESKFSTNLENVFACGDATNSGASIAIRAIGEAEKASRVIDSYLKGNLIPYKKPYVSERTDVTAETLADRPRLSRAQMTHLAIEERRDNFHEVNNGFTDEDAVREASRCLECGCHDYFECKLIKRANEYDVKPEKYEGEKHHRTVDNTHPFIERNPDKCILCGLCVRVCDEVMGRSALGLVGRGFDTMASPSLKRPLKETSCISCGQCVDLCPTGALGEKYPYGKRVPAETETVETICPFCSVGCKVLLEKAGDMVVKAVPAEGKTLCVRGRFGYGELLKKDRITTPMIKRNGTFIPVSYEEAAMYIAKKMQSTSIKYGKEAVAVSISDKLTSQQIYVARKYAKHIARAGSIFCYNYHMNGVKEVIGADVSTCKIEELISTDVIVMVGTNVMEEHASLGVAVRKGVKNGAKLIVINNVPESQEAREADIYIQSDSTDGIREIMKALIEEGAKPEDVATPEEAKKFRESLGNLEISEKAREAAKILMREKKAIVVTDQFNLSHEGEKAAADLAVLSGHIGNPRNGILQIKTNVNTQGLANLGISPVCVMKEKLRGGVFKSIFIIGEDVYGFDRSNMDFVAVADLYMTETAKKADVVYPLVSLFESTGMVVSMDGTIREIDRVVKPKAKSNVAAIAIIANAMKANFHYNSSEEVKREIIETNAAKIAQIQPSLKTPPSVALYHNNPNTNGIYFKV